MKKAFGNLIATMAVLAALVTPASAQKSKTVTPKTDLKPTQTVQLYPRWSEPLTILEGKKSEMNAANTGKVKVSNRLSGPEAMDQFGRITNVTDSSARIELYIPKKCNGKMVIVCPGGAYKLLASFHEGVYVAEWLNNNDIAAAVLYYRMPNHNSTVPMDDLSTALRYCRAHAKEWGIKEIGVMGFSAGGHLVCSVSENPEDKESRPDFTIAIYPRLVITPKTQCGTRTNLLPDTDNWKDLGGKEKKAEQSAYKQLCEKYSCEKNISRNMPPIFIAHSYDDKVVDYEESMDFFEELVKKGVKCELHVYPEGGHGWGFVPEKAKTKDDKFKDCREGFQAELKNWIDKL